MAVFKAPRINTEKRLNLILDASEIVYDTDENQFYGGNGLDEGGFLIGGNGSGSSAGTVYYTFTLSQSNINSKSIDINNNVLPQYLSLEIAGGIRQLYGTDFEIVGSAVTWDGLGLDGFLEAGDVLIIGVSAEGSNTEVIQINQTHIDSKQVELLATPSNTQSIRLDVVGGVPQLYYIDYVVIGNVLTWGGKGLDNFLEVGDVIIIQY